MALTEFEQAVEKERRANLLKGLPASGFVPETKLQSRVPRGQLQSDGSRLVIDQRPVVQSNNIKPPTLRELPNVQRDAELGKMNVSTNGNIVTYDIGGNTLSYDASQKDKVARTSLNKANSNGVQRVGNMDVQFDPSVTSEARKRFLENPVRPTAQIDRFEANQNVPINRYPGVTSSPTRLLKDLSPGELFVEGLQSRRDKATADIANMEAEQSISRANLFNLADRNQIAREGLDIERDANRLQELDIKSQNKLRDIQGQVAQEPPIKESALKPMVIEEADPIDPTGNTKRQRIMIPNAEGTGYVDGMVNQPATNIGATLTPEQKAKAVAYAKANPNINKAVILQKIANGEI